MYEILKQQKEKQEQGQNGEEEQESQSKESRNSSSQNSGDEKEQGENQEQNQNAGKQQEEDSENVGHDSHDLWEKAIEERKKEQEKSQEQESKEEQPDEKKAFEENREERKKRLQDFNKELVSKSAGKGKSISDKQLSDIGIAKPLIDWRRLLKQATKYEEKWTRKNARMRDGYFRHRLEQIPIPESEIVLDVSGSVSETLLRNFLRECKNILDNSRVKVRMF